MDKKPRLLNIKMAIIGTYNIGKSYLGKRWMTGEYIDKPQSTIAAGYLTKNVYIDGKEVKCHVWDTAGSEKYNSIIPIYIRDTQVVMICFEKFKEETVLFHMDMVTSTNKDAAIFLVLTKCDIDSGNDLGNINDFAKDHNFPFFKTSAKTGEGVKELFEYAARIAFMAKEDNEYIKSLDLEKEIHAVVEPQGSSIIF
jgi:small GTP-binding protein